MKYTKTTQKIEISIEYMFSMKTSDIRNTCIYTHFDFTSISSGNTKFILVPIKHEFHSFLG